MAGEVAHTKASASATGVEQAGRTSLTDGACRSNQKAVFAFMKTETEGRGPFLSTNEAWRSVWPYALPFQHGRCRCREPRSPALAVPWGPGMGAVNCRRQPSALTATRSETAPRDTVGRMPTDAPRSFCPVARRNWACQTFGGRGQFDDETCNFVPSCDPSLRGSRGQRCFRGSKGKLSVKLARPDRTKQGDFT